MVDLPSLGPLLGSGNVADVHAYGELALKLYRPGVGPEPAFREAATLAALVDRNLPVPHVHQVAQFDGRWGLVIDRIPGRPLAALMQDHPDEVPRALDEMVALQLQFHAVTEVRLPALTAVLAERLGQAPGLKDEARSKLLDRLAQQPDDTRLCHGDFHPFNIIGPLGQTRVIDWLDATSGPPAADACRTYLLLHPTHPDLAEAYITLYARRSATPRDAILSWLPILAAARLLEGIPGQQTHLLHLAETA